MQRIGGSRLLNRELPILGAAPKKAPLSVTTNWISKEEGHARDPLDGLSKQAEPLARRWPFRSPTLCWCGLEKICYCFVASDKISPQCAVLEGCCRHLRAEPWACSHTSLLFLNKWAEGPRLPLRRAQNKPFLGSVSGILGSKLVNDLVDTRGSLCEEKIPRLHSYVGLCGSYVGLCGGMKRKQQPPLSIQN